jgi:hypothetical protein
MQAKKLIKEMNMKNIIRLPNITAALFECFEDGRPFSPLYNCFGFLRPAGTFGLDKSWV